MGFLALVLRYRKPLLVLVLVAGLVLAGITMYRKYRQALQDKTIAELALVGQKTLLDSTEARLAVGTIARDSLAHALSAEKLLSGTLRAALLIKIPARETTIVDHWIPTRAENGERRATFRDSTFAGIISGQVFAPVYPEALSISYQVFRPAFSPTVAFVQVGDTVVATVHWQGEQAQISAPYWRPTYHPKLLQGFAELNYTTYGWDTRVGPLMNVGNHLQLNAWAGYDFGKADSTGAGLKGGVGLRGIF